MHTSEESLAAIEKASAQDQAWFLFNTARTYERDAIPGEMCGEGCVCIEGYDALIEVKYIAKGIRTRRLVMWVEAS